MTYKHLSREERYTISILRRKGESCASIASSLGRSLSTIRRELKRNSTEAGGYRYEHAHKLASSRSVNASCRSSSICKRSWNFAKRQLINEQWSPEQIAGELIELGMKPISHETIYKRIYQDMNNRGELYKHLRHKVRPYKNRSLKNDKRGQISNQTSIELRPPEVEQRLSIGHWEIDTIIGKASGNVLVTMVERYSRYTLIARADNKTAEAVSFGLLRRLAPIRNRVETLTYDNGKEFAKHLFIDDILESQGYFAHPYSSWERGLNENTNGLIRQYFPKRTDFNKITDEQIAQVEAKLNRRPRKCLDRKTPNYIFFNN
jgi:transposase, IS30 family